MSVRTTLHIDDDVLNAAKDIARRHRTTTGAVISDLARRALVDTACPATARTAEPRANHGFAPLPARGAVVTDDLVNRLRGDVGD